MQGDAIFNASIGEEWVWHDVECGAYVADLPTWLELAAEAAGPVLELGSGTGRVALELARDGHLVCGLERSPALAEELRRRAAGEGRAVEVVEADARRFELERRFALICAPMQFFHLLGGATGRRSVLERCRAHLADRGAIAIAILAGPPAPAPAAEAPVLPDVLERHGWVYSSQPLEVRAIEGGLVVIRLRQLVSPAGDLTEEVDQIRLDELDAESLRREAAALGLRLRECVEIPPTPDHVGSSVLVFEEDS